MEMPIGFDCDSCSGGVGRMVAEDLVSLFLWAEIDALALLVVAQENALSLRLLEEMAPSKVHLLEELAQNRPGQLSAEGVVFLDFFSRE